MSYAHLDIIEGDTIPHLFGAYDGGTGASIVISGLAVTDIEVFKDGSVTQRASDNGYALLDTDGIDFDGRVGIHGFSIDSSDNSDAGFYVVGPIYHVVVDAITVDAQTVRFVAFSFRLHDATRGMAGTALPDAAAEAAGGLFTRGTGAGQINQDANGRIDTHPVALAANVITAASIAAAAMNGKGDWTVGAVTLADGAHGGTSAVLTLERVVIASTTLNEPGLKITGDGTDAGVEITGGATGPGVLLQGVGSASGLRVVGGGTGAGASFIGGLTSGDAVNFAVTSGIEINGDMTGDITGTIDLVTNLTNLPSIPSNWLTAAGIAAGALNGKGDWNIGKTGYALSATGADLILKTSLFALAIADAIADEVFTGGTHNVPDSFARRLRDLQEFGVYEGGAVWFDSVNGSGGTTDFESGTAFNPVDNVADLNTLLASLGLSKVHVASGSLVTLAASQTNQLWEGSNWTLVLAGQDISGSEFIGASVSGAVTGTGTTQIFVDCIMGSTSHIKGTHLIRCGLSGTQTIVEAGDFFTDSCHSAEAGTASPLWDFGAALNSSNLNIRHHSGGIEVANMGAGTGTYNMSLEGEGQLIIAASCSAASLIAIRGHFEVTDNAGGAVTLADRVNFDSILDASGLVLSNLTSIEGETTIDGQTIIGAYRIFGAVLAGKSSGGGSVFRSMDDVKTRVTSTVDGSSNRTAVTLVGT